MAALLFSLDLVSLASLFSFPFLGNGLDLGRCRSLWLGAASVGLGIGVLHVVFSIVSSSGWDFCISLVWAVLLSPTLTWGCSFLHLVIKVVGLGDFLPGFVALFG